MNQNVEKELAPALQKALNDYLAFSEGSPPSDIKEFNAYQGACKSALLHIALLVKLTQNQTPVDTVIPDLSALLEQAKKELSPNDFSGISVDLG